MKLDRLTPTDFQLDVQAEELAALMAAARCAIEPGCTGLNPATHDVVERLLREYDRQATGANLRPVTLRLDPPVDDHYRRVQHEPF